MKGERTTIIPAKGKKTISVSTFLARNSVIFLSLLFESARVTQLDDDGYDHSPQDHIEVAVDVPCLDFPELVSRS
jgi:hypothetical protein